MSDFSAQLTASQRQTQQLAMNRLQGLELLHLSTQELEQRLNRELNENPMLEEEFPELPPAAEAPGFAGESGDDETDGELLSGDGEWHDELPLPSDAPGDGETPADYWMDSAAPAPSLSELLETEVATSGLPPEEERRVRFLIDELDESGFLSIHLADAAMACDANLPEMERALAYLQSLDPPGVGARDLGECLKLQLQRRGVLTPLREKLLQVGLEDIAENRLPALSEKLGIPQDQLKEEIRLLGTLDPAPGHSAAARSSGIILPELEIVPDGDGFTARRLRERERKIGISKTYSKLLADPDLSAGDRAFLREKLQHAREFLRALEERGDTLLKLGEFIAREQAEFFRKGAEALRPMTMKQAGSVLGVHETTVSRAAAEKYAVTPQGVLPLRYFFSSGYSSGDSGELSNRAVMEKIRELVAEEDTLHPLSDEKLSALLGKEGLKVARRTVAKYRDQLHIPAASARKRRH